MLKKIFNQLVKKIPYGVVLSVFFTFWSAVVAFSLGAVLVFSKADFFQTGTQDIFLLNLVLSVAAVFLAVFSTHGILRFLGSDLFEPEDYKVLNDNIKQGQVKEALSSEELKRLFSVLEGLGIKEAFVSGISVVFVMSFILIGEYLASGGQFTNFFAIIAGGAISGFFAVVFTPLHTEILTTDARAQVKGVMVEKGVEYKEKSLWSIRGKMGFVVFLMTVLIFTQCLVLYPDIEYNFLVISLTGLVIVALLIMILTSSFYRGVLNIAASTSRLAKGERGIFFSGSLDKELVRLSQDLNKAAKEIYHNRKKLKETEQVLKIRVRAKTRELKELNEGLECKVKERTKELRDRVDELERIHKLTVGREKKMIELKKENKELREKLEKHKGKEKGAPASD